ncbi:DUF4129 domain-containing protein [Paenibacillus sp. JCM 10914]|uniref:DUF4129 domain-containing protein n=1 Tax=Paenibacillus sp. JCM 10914 TaxID=1236974 RepID=UPI0003CC5D8F|nr:DUF4129 domain-containing protein [Paenibacillus sp. JCM 10914]GAE04953.1 hypothetical protein JCM10914_1030 [Paenibacillus sp. JCM 10914]
MCAVFPVLFVPAFYLFPQHLVVAWPFIVFGSYVIGYLGGILFKISRRYAAVFWALLVSIAISFAVLGMDLMLAYTIPLLFMTTYRGSRMGQVSWHMMFPGTSYLVGLIVYGVSSFILHFMESFDTGSAVLAWMGGAALIITLLMTNHQRVLNETLPGDKQPVLERRVLRYNRSFILVLLVLIAIVAFLPQLQQWFSELARGIAAWLAGLFGPGAEQPPETPSMPEAVPEMPLMEEEPSGPSPFMKMMEQILMYAVFAILGAGVLFLLYKILRVLPKLTSRLSEWMNRMMNRQGEVTALGYEDEVERIDHEPASHRFRRFIASMKRSGGASNEDQASPNQAVRATYRNILSRSIRKGYLWRSALTPRETERDLKSWDNHTDTIPESLIELYEEARYGSRRITKEEWEQVQHKLRHSSKPSKK